MNFLFKIALSSLLIFWCSFTFGHDSSLEEQVATKFPQKQLVLYLNNFVNYDNSGLFFASSKTCMKETFATSNTSVVQQGFTSLNLAASSDAANSFFALFTQLKKPLLDNEATKKVVELGKVVNGAGSWMDEVFDIQNSVFNQNKNIIANMSSNHKGAWGEITTDAYLTEKGFQPLHLRKTALTDGWGETGIDGIFKKDGQYYIIEAKYTGHSTLNTTIDGKQLSNTWIEGSSRLENAVDGLIAADIIDKGYRKIWTKVAPDGTVTFKEATDNFATTFKDFTP